MEAVPCREKFIGDKISINPIIPFIAKVRQILLITEVPNFTSPPTRKCDILLHQYYYVLVLNVKCFRDNLCNFLDKLGIFVLFFTEKISDKFDKPVYR